MKSLKSVDEQFPDLNYPIGEIWEYKYGADNRTAINRSTNEEKKVFVYLRQLIEFFISNYCTLTFYLTRYGFIHSRYGHSA